MSTHAVQLLCAYVLIFGLAVGSSLLADRLSSDFFAIATWVLGIGGLSVLGALNNMINPSRGLGFIVPYAILSIVCCVIAVVFWKMLGQLAMLIAAIAMGVSAAWAFFHVIDLLTTNAS